MLTATSTVPLSARRQPASSKTTAIATLQEALIDAMAKNANLLEERALLATQLARAKADLFALSDELMANTAARRQNVTFITGTHRA